jgi:hypothetical protein
MGGSVPSRLHCPACPSAFRLLASNQTQKGAPTASLNVSVIAFTAVCPSFIIISFIVVSWEILRSGNSNTTSSSRARCRTRFSCILSSLKQDCYTQSSAHHFGYRTFVDICLQWQPHCHQLLIVNSFENLISSFLNSGRESFYINEGGTLVQANQLLLQC